MDRNPCLVVVKSRFLNYKKIVGFGWFSWMHRIFGSGGGTTANFVEGYFQGRAPFQIELFSNLLGWFGLA